MIVAHLAYPLFEVLATIAFFLLGALLLWMVTRFLAGVFAGSDVPHERPGVLTKSREAER